MEYIFLILQIMFILGIFVFKTNNRYLVVTDKCYKKYLIIELITQGMCVIANIIIMFITKEIMIYVLVIHIILMGLILIFYSNKAKKIYFNELINIIKKIIYYLLKLQKLENIY
ncbi:MAG: hypothetical protein V8Q77_02675 [Bacilli bacterium]